MKIIRQTHTLDYGRSLEVEAEERGALVRLRARLCRAGFVVEALKVTAPLTKLLLDRDFLPKEFARYEQIAQATLSPLDEIWDHRLRLRGPGS